MCKVPSGSPALTVFYDGACPLCRSEIGLYTTCRGADQVAFVNVAELPAGDVIPGLNKSAALARFHVMQRDGRLESGAAGFARLWLALPGWRWLGRLVSLPGIAQAAELGYRLFLPIRHGLQWLIRKVR